MSKTTTRLSVLCLTIVGFLGLLSAVMRFMGNPLETAADSQEKIEICFAIMLICPAFWLIERMRRGFWRSMANIAMIAVMVIILMFLASSGVTDPKEGGSDDRIITKLVPVAVLIAFILVTTLYERKRNARIANGFVMRFGLAFKKCCDGYDVISQDGCSMRNTPHGVEFYDAQGNPTAFKATDIATKWKIVKEDTE